ncbi:hypothetical protein A3C87_00965 [Candidatus Kaiserbacteria bacterium RIFCSPHIGHO2_02_FULL_49_34]|uniref:UDP-N-acetylglucosamine--N-acetylmuramyl-(pentapeptide) pyrophosphoryl-undecaprenol N-acetylglucosamine transferase n=1 Tax=Candidatus Kaiserbacteria bacterium RIFCSPHIGHO2_02_FULL_49_34 TaxID=1798491 RepID=A0A1F6DML7_9BACT|nr:MAG: hypothetical protein A3C87_00965 [Candidatus Kaiserbacteria bacterium RIFCSPHIGHO2_02_FULL_49_34]
MKIFLVGGGTGGHFYPLIAVAEALKTQVPAGELQMAYIGPDAFEQSELDRVGIRYVWCPAGKVRRYVSILNITDLFKTLFGVLVAFFKLLAAYPDVILSKGGYTAVPVILAARILRVPVVIHESDARMGRANELAAGYAKYIAVSYPHMLENLPKEKTAFVGIPARAGVRAGETSEAAAYEMFGITDTQVPVILVLGGSLGAENLNLLMMNSLDTLLPKYTILHQTGRVHGDVVAGMARELIIDPRLTPRYIMRDYLSAEEMHAAMEIADVIISRAGSGAISEIALHGKPSILVPIPESVSHDQLTNAYSYANTGAAYVLEEENAREHILGSLLDDLLQNATTYIQMSEAARAFAKPDAAEKVAHALIAIAKKH